LGAELLGRSRRPVLQLAALIAGTHHERWDGTGYPEGLAKEAIPLVGRLVAVADVFDALLSRRCYKEPWSADETIAYFQAERGGHFDPALVDLVVAHRDELLDLRSRYPDQDQKS
jgi:response regulator RpfG family c-di-GMP phosphodiesterase